MPNAPSLHNVCSDKIYMNSIATITPDFELIQYSGYAWLQN
jgi:hypothetical protein